MSIIVGPEIISNPQIAALFCVLFIFHLKVELKMQHVYIYFFF